MLVSNTVGMIPENVLTTVLSIENTSSIKRVETVGISSDVDILFSIYINGEQIASRITSAAKPIKMVRLYNTLIQVGSFIEVKCVHNVTDQLGNATAEVNWFVK